MSFKSFCTIFAWAMYLGRLKGKLMFSPEDRNLVTGLMCLLININDNQIISLRHALSAHENLDKLATDLLDKILYIKY